MAIGNPGKLGDMAIVIGGPRENRGLIVQIVAVTGRNTWEIKSSGIKLVGWFGKPNYCCHNVPDADLYPIRGEKPCQGAIQTTSQKDTLKVKA